jgi:ketosteroid isomerase-like protein
VASGNVELLSEFFAAWNRGDLEWALDHLGPEFEYRTAELFPGVDAVYRGREGWIKFWNTIREPWENITIELERVVDLGDCVVELTAFHAKGKESGVEVALKYANIVMFRDGMFSRIVGFGSDWTSALRAADVPGERPPDLGLTPEADFPGS